MSAAYVLTIIDGQDMQKPNKLRPVAVTSGGAQPRGAEAAHPWAGQARAQFRATGETARPREPGPTEQLTPQELLVARFIAAGASTLGELAAVSVRDPPFRALRTIARPDLLTVHNVAICVTPSTGRAHNRGASPHLAPSRDQAASGRGSRLGAPF